QTDQRADGNARPAAQQARGVAGALAAQAAGTTRGTTQRTRRRGGALGLPRGPAEPAAAAGCFSRRCRSIVSAATRSLASGGHLAHNAGHVVIHLSQLLVGERPGGEHLLAFIGHDRASEGMKGPRADFVFALSYGVDE